jgi:hypothetical protein
MPGEGTCFHVAMQSSARDPHCARITGRPLFALLLSLFLANSHADEAYVQGIDAFNRGDYEAAISQFLASDADSSDRALLHYNLGASYYKTGRYREAGESFLRVIVDPELAALGSYNLALVNAQLGQPEQVVYWLQRTIDTADNPKLRALAQAMLARHSAGEAAPVTSPAPGVMLATSPWSGFIVGETGYDSNVILLSDSQTLLASEQDDFFFDTFIYLIRQFRETESGLRPALEGNVYIIKYQDIDGYDVDSLRLGGTLGKDFAGWATSGGIHLTYNFLDGHEFTFEPQLNLSASRWLKPNRSRLRLRYEGSRINSRDPLYYYLDGWRHRTDARMTWTRGRQQLHLMYQLEANNREELDAPRFTSYSPIRSSVRLGVESPVGGLFDAAIEVQYYRSHYLNPNELTDGGSLTRRDHRLSTVARITHGFRGGNELSLEYRRNDNHSNIDDYDYTQYTAMLGLLLAF